MKIVVIDGQGGRMGRAIIDLLKGRADAEVFAVGTNSAATSTMISGNTGTVVGATGENAVIVNCRDADYIIGPIGIIVADALHGEVSPPMAAAVGQSRAKKILLPVSRCNTVVLGTRELPMGELVKLILPELED